MNTYYTVMLRHQLLLERIKGEQKQDSTQLVTDLAANLQETLNNLGVKHLDQLNKKQLIQLLAKIQLQQSEAWAGYRDKLIVRIHQLIGDEHWWLLLLLNKLNKSADRVPTVETLIKGYMNNVNPAFGETPVKVFNTAADAYIRRVLTTIQKGYAQKALTSDVLLQLAPPLKRLAAPPQRLLPGPKNNSKITQAQVDAVIDTMMQSASAQTQASGQGSIYDFYQWISVMDERTTVYCQDHNLRVYTYGNGPIPPAHPNCRSTIAPLDDEGKTTDETLDAFMQKQTDEMLDILLGVKARKAFRAGTIDAHEAMQSAATNKSDMHQAYKKILEDVE